VCLARWESQGTHRNPNGEAILGPHKHQWTEDDEDRCAYVPDDIDESTRDTILVTFLEECGIDLEGEYEPQLPGIGQ